METFATLTDSPGNPAEEFDNPGPFTANALAISTFPGTTALVSAPPPITSDRDFNDALGAYNEISDIHGGKLMLGNAIADYQTERIFREYYDPAEGLAKREREEKFSALDALARDWKQFPEARKRAVEACGEDFVNDWESCDEQGRAYLGGLKVLTDLYSKEGDGEFDPIRRYRQFNETPDVENTTSVWSHFAGQLKPYHEEEVRQMELSRGISRKSGPLLERLLSGETLLEAMEAAPNLTDEERGYLTAHCDAGSEWFKTVQTVRQWVRDNGISFSLSEDKIRERMQYLKERYAEDNLHSGGVLAWAKPCGYTQEEWREKAIQALCKESSLSEQDTYNVAKNMLVLKQTDENAYNMLVGLYKFQMDRQRNEGTAFFSPFAQTLGSMLSSAMDGVASAAVGDIMPGDTVSVSAMGGAMTFATYNSSGNAVRRTRDPELIEQMNLIKSMQAEIAESPDGAWWIRRQLDGLGKMAAQTAVFLGTRGMGTFAALTNDRYDELRADGHGIFESVLRGGIAGGTEVLTERLGGEFFGRNLRWIARKTPGMQKVTGYFGGIGDLMRAGMYKNAAFRFSGYSLGAGGSEWMEELIQPTMQAPLDAGLAHLFGSKDGMSYEDWKGQLRQACSPDMMFQMAVFGGACGVIQIPAMAREAQIARTGPGAIQALARCSDERAREIADMVDPVEKRAAIIEESVTNILSKEVQEQNVSNGIANMQEDFSSLKAMAAYEAQVELGNMPRMEAQEDGSWLVYDKVEGSEGVPVEAEPRQLTEQQALAEINARMESGVAQQINVIQSNLVARAAVGSMKTTGRFDFERMSDTETAATIETMARAARLRMDEGMSASAIDPSISKYLSQGTVAAMPGKVQEREAIAREQGNYSPFSSNAYRVALGRSRTLIRFVEGKVTTAELMEEAVESYLSEFLHDSGHSIDWAANNLREVQRYLREEGVLKGNLIALEGESSLMQVVEAMGTLARGDVMRRIESLNMPQFIKDFLKWARSLFVSAGNLAELGHAFYQLDQSGKLDKTFAQSIYDAAGITEQIWADAAMDATYLDLAMIATRAVAGKTEYLDIQNEAFRAWNAADESEAAAHPAPQETAEALVPHTEHPHDGVPGAPAAAGEYGAIEYVAVNELTLSQDVPQFKEGASETGETDPFDHFDERVAPPIHVWRRSDGRMEVISGRHRWQARKRDGGESIMAYIHDEADGFSQKDAEMLDVTLNIKEGQGSVLDWARYIRSAGISMEDAREQGLLRGRGVMGVLVGVQASEDVFALFAAGKIGEKTAAAIAAFPDHNLQRVGIHCIGKRMTAQETVNVMAAVQIAQSGDAGNRMTTGSLFGEDDSALAAAERIGRFATVMQQKIADKINAVRGAAKRPETARSLGVDVNDPAALLKTLSDLEMQRRAWLSYARFPELYRQAAGWDGESSLASIEPALADLGIDMSASMTVGGNEIDLRKCRVTDNSGNVLDSETYITTPSGSFDWFRFPQDERTKALLKKKGIPDLPIRLKVGRHRDEHSGFGLLHLLNHFDDMASRGNSPLEFLYYTLTHLNGMYDQGGSRRTFKANRTFKEGGLLHVDLQADNGCYSMVSCYPIEGQKKPRGNELLIGGAVFRFSPSSEATPIPDGNPSLNTATESVGTRGKVREGKVALPVQGVNIHDVQVIDSRGDQVYIQPRVSDISFSVVGSHAANWEELRSRAFEGRDDGKPRVELDASQSFIKPGVAARIARRLAGDRSERKVRFTLGDVLEYPELYAAYPKLAKMPVVLADLGSRGTRAWFNPDNRNIKINTLNFSQEGFDIAALRSTLLHEVQHAIQSVEGYASGSPGSTNFWDYVRAGGEIESRNVQKRMDMTAAERAATPFNDMLEYPGEALVNIDPAPIEIPFNLVSGEYSSDWSALKRSSNSAHMEFVKLIINALNKDAERMTRYQELSEDEHGDMAVTLMRATNLAKTAAMYLPKGWRIGLKPYLDWMEVFAEVAHAGKLEWAATAPAPYWSEMMKRHLRKMEDLYGIATGDSAETLEYMKDYGETRLYMLVNKLIRRVSRNLEEYGSAKIRENIESLIDSAKPKQKDNRQYRTGVMSIQSFRELARLRELMLMEEDAYTDEHDKFTGRLLELRQNEEEAGMQDEIDKLEARLMELEVYGCMGIKSIDELDRLHTCLTRFVRGEKSAWEESLEQRKQRRREMAESIIQGVTERKGPLDSTVVARARHDEKEKGGRKSWLRRTFVGMQTIESLPQLLSVLEKFPDTRALAHGIRIRLARASGRLDIMDKHVDGLFRKWGMEAFGVDPKAKAANFHLDRVLNDFKKKDDTGIRLERYERRKLRLPLDMARLFVDGVGVNADGLEAGRAKMEELRAGLEEEIDFLTARLEEEIRTGTGNLETDKALRKAEDRLAVLDMQLDGQDAAALNEWLMDYDASLEEKRAEAARGDGRLPREKEFAEVSYNRHLGTEGATLELSRDSALYLVLLSEQTDYEGLMSLHGFTPDVIARLRRYVGDGGLLLGDRMRAHLKRQGKRISAVFEALNGVPFASIENYFPARFKVDNKLADFDMAQMLQGMTGFRQGGATGFLAGRTRHHAGLDLNLGAAAVFRDAVATSEHWMQTQDIVADLRGVLGTPHVIDALTVQFGRNSVALLKQWVHGLENLGRMDGNAKSMMDVTTSELYNSGAVAILSYKVESVVRQLSGIANMWAGDNTLSAADWARGMALTQSGKGGITFSEMLGSKYVKARVMTNDDIAGRRLSRMEAGRRFNVFDRLANLGMVPIGWMDAASNALPATVLFNAHFERARKTPLPDGSKRTDAQARQVAWDYTMAAFAQGAQPTRAWDKSHFGNILSSIPLGRAFSFMMSENLNKLGLVSSLLRQGRYGKAAGVWLAYGTLNAAIGLLLDAMRDDPDEWKERDMRGYLWAIAFGNLSGIPLVSEGLEWLIGQTGAKVYLGSAGRGVIDAKSFFSSSKRVGKMATDHKHHSGAEWIGEVSRLSRTFGAVGGACGNTLGSAMLYFSALANPAKTAADMSESAMVRD